MQYGVVQYSQIQCRLYCANRLILTGTEGTRHTTFTGKVRDKVHAPFTDAKENVFGINSK